METCWSEFPCFNREDQCKILTINICLDLRRQLSHAQSVKHLATFKRDSFSFVNFEQFLRWCQIHSCILISVLDAGNLAKKCLCKGDKGLIWMFVSSFQRISNVVLISYVIKDLSYARSLSFGFVPVTTFRKCVISFDECPSQCFIGVVEWFSSSLWLGPAWNNIRIGFVKIIAQNVVVWFWFLR